MRGSSQLGSSLELTVLKLSVCLPKKSLLRPHAMSLRGVPPTSPFLFTPPSVDTEFSANNWNEETRKRNSVVAWSSMGAEPLCCQANVAGVASVRKAITGVHGRIPLHAKNGVFTLPT